MKGGSLKTNKLKQFLEASYLDPAPNEINGYSLDTTLSNLYGKVYVNTNLKRLLLVFVERKKRPTGQTMRSLPSVRQRIH